MHFFGLKGAKKKEFFAMSPLSILSIEWRNKWNFVFIRLNFNEKKSH